MLILIADTLHLCHKHAHMDAHTETYTKPLCHKHAHMEAHTETYTKNMQGERIAGYTDSRRGWNAQRWVDGKSKRTREQREERWNGKTQRTKKHIEQETNMAQERQKRHTEERNPRWRVETAERRPEPETGNAKLTK